MGAQISKTAAGKEDAAAAVEPAADGAAVAAKANGQENGHAKTNGDASPATEEANKAEVQANGSTPVEDAPKEGEEKVEVAEANGEKEPAAAATNGEAKAEDGATPSGSEDAKQKKKRFSFKKPNFKLSGFSFRKTKKDSEEATGEEEGAAAAAPAEGEEKPAEEGGAAASEEAKPDEATKEEAEAPAAAAAADEPKAEEAKAEGEVGGGARCGGEARRSFTSRARNGRQSRGPGRHRVKRAHRAMR
ncbi:Myristoylated alanine-rich C-kinase substrate [Merluccius polli]|uniref:Myristoylated alanine-rich C-kinase substrate n=1 Tax=Merluccius polli TaxID=89951 RepID=A0AA47MI52_MERPO|nr:Myristoylated alanine-rich C-kinase substrate [Merluccius polli]